MGNIFTDVGYHSRTFRITGRGRQIAGNVRVVYMERDPVYGVEEWFLKDGRVGTRRGRKLQSHVSGAGRSCYVRLEDP